MEDAIKRAKEMLSNATLGDLLDQWELTTENNDQAIYEVRGWLMDELESRNPEAFNAWLESEAADDKELRWYMMK